MGRLNTSTSGYAFKAVVAIAVTPLLYALHEAVHLYMGDPDDFQVH